MIMILYIFLLSGDERIAFCVDHTEHIATRIEVTVHIQ